MTRRTFSASLMASAGLPAASAKKPNILFITSDQHSSHVLGANGHPIVRTPNLDRLAARGVNFRNAYSGNPVCVPGRASMMTGRYASDVNSYCNSTPLARHPSWGNALRDAGYRCWATGKLDLTQGVDYGFEETRTSHGHCKKPDITSLFRAPVCFRPGERDNVNGRFEDREDSDGELAKRAIGFLRKQSGAAPWCVYAGPHMPHPKWIAQKKYEEIYPPARMPLPQIPDGYLEKRHAAFQILANFKNMQTPIPADRQRRARAAYFGMVTELDEYIGWMIDDLEKTGQIDNTVIVYTSDHGEMLGDHGLWLKNVLLDNAARVPLIIAGPGMPKGKTIDTPVTHCDMVATMLDLAGVKAASPIRGHSLAAMDRHPGFAYSESHSEGNYTGSFMIRKGDWKYLYFTGDEPLLFNMRDPGEYVNLAGRKETADIQKELHGILLSQVDPDAVTKAAFGEQARVLERMVSTLPRDKFIAELEGRLGAGQANVIAGRLYAN